MELTYSKSSRKLSTLACIHVAWGQCSLGLGSVMQLQHLSHVTSVKHSQLAIPPSARSGQDLFNLHHTAACCAIDFCQEPGRTCQGQYKSTDTSALACCLCICFKPASRLPKGPCWEKGWANAISQEQSETSYLSRSLSVKILSSCPTRCTSIMHADPRS